MAIVRRRPSKMAHRADIVMVWVRASARGSGAATAMLRALEDAARRLSLSQLELAVTAENLPAIRFYQRNGYRQIGLVPSGFRHDGCDIDEVLMAKSLG